MPVHNRGGWTPVESLATKYCVPVVVLVLSVPPSGTGASTTTSWYWYRSSALELLEASTV
jgi:hypothetical protein